MPTTKVEAKVKILNWVTGSVLYESETATTLKDAVNEANLREADLHGADLYGANLHGADLEKLPQDYINQCSRDMLFIFEHLKSELPGLRKALIEGRVDGTQYEGECACLIGTLGNLDGGVDKVCEAIPFYEKGIHNPGEAWFLNIHKGDTPEDNQFAAHALKLIDLVIGKDAPTNTATNKRGDKGKK